MEIESPERPPAKPKPKPRPTDVRRVPPEILEPELDSIVKAINQLRSDVGRCTVDDVAAKTGIPRNTAWRRMRVLVDRGVVESLGRGGFRCTSERIKT